MISQKRFREECSRLLVEAGRTLDAPMLEALDRYVVTVGEARRMRRLVRRGDAEPRELVRLEDAAARFGQALGLEPQAPARLAGRPKGSAPLKGTAPGLGVSPAARLRSVS